MREATNLTVILPNYNHAAFVGDALKALLTQSTRPARIIVIDDGSTDDSIRAIKAATAGAPGVEVLRNGRNLGVLASVERGLELCESELVYMASSDNWVLPGFFEEMLSLARRHPKAGLFLSDMAFCDAAENGRLYPKHLGLAQAPAYLSPEEVVSRLRIAGHILPGYGCIFRRDALLQAGGFPVSLRWHADWFTELVIAFRHGCAYLPEPRVACRLLQNSYSSGARNRSSQREVLRGLLGLLCSDAYSDVAEAFVASGALAYFGVGIVPACWEHPIRWPLLRRLPYRDLAWREAKNLLIRLGPSRVRQLFWTARHALQRSIAPVADPERGT